MIEEPASDGSQKVGNEALAFMEYLDAEMEGSITRVVIVVESSNSVVAYRTNTDKSAALGMLSRASNLVRR